jgi:acyl carrier protein
MDFQVKVRGFRVELQEIENYLQSHIKVKEAVVIVKQEESSEKYLCAIILGADGNMPQVGELREFLSQKIPGYMIPSYFVEIEEMPLTPNGKVDRKALAGYVGNPLRTGTAHVAPGTGIEKVVAGLWQEVLKLDKVGIHDNFFEIGGNSMNLVQLSNKLQKRLEIENPAVSLFRYPTIHSFLLFLNRGDGIEAISSERIDESITDLEETMGILMEE